MVHCYMFLVCLYLSTFVFFSISNLIVCALVSIFASFASLIRSHTHQLWQLRDRGVSDARVHLLERTVAELRLGMRTESDDVVYQYVPNNSTNL